MAVRSCWILAGTGTHCRIRRSRASPTCSMGDMSSEYAGMFSASRNSVQILATWGRALSCRNMRWWSWMNGTTMASITNAINKMHLCSLSITYACPYHPPTATMGHHGPLNPQRWHQQTAHTHDAIHAVFHLPCTVPVGCTAKFYEMPLETAYGRKINIQFRGNSSGGHSCSQHANCTLPQNVRHLWLCAVW